jgi:phage gpG-like protein
MDESGRYHTRFFSGEVFASRGQVFGKPWAALNDNYAGFKARTFPGRPPLIRSGLMNRSFKHKSTKLTASLWNEAEYFDYHQEGRGLPERVMMHVDDQRERRVVDYIAEDINGKMQAAGV